MPACSDNWSMASMQETTERMVRKQVQARLGVDVSHRKAFIKEQVSVPPLSPLSLFTGTRPTCLWWIILKESTWVTASRARCTSTPDAQWAVSGLESEFPSCIRCMQCAAGTAAL